MPFVPNTPEAHAALLDPAAPPTVCRGISNDGNPCKRTLVPCTTKNDPASGRQQQQPQSGVIAIVNKQQAYFCARHQDQARDIVLRHTASFARRRALVGRGSMDTLIEQVELLVAVGGSTARRAPRPLRPFRPAPANDDEDGDGDGPKALAQPKPPSLPTAARRHQEHKKEEGGNRNENKGENENENRGANETRQRQRQKKRPGLWKRLLLGCCCVAAADDPDDPGDERHLSARRREAELRAAAAAVLADADGLPRQPMRARREAKAASHAHVAFQSVPPTPPLPGMSPPAKQPAPQSTLVAHAPAPTHPRPSKTAGAATAGLSPTTPASLAESDVEEEVPALDVGSLAKPQQDCAFLAPPHPPALYRLTERTVLKLIPASVHPRRLGRLQQELLKPLSDKDEPGYIYMFWLTDSPLSPSPSPAATPAAAAARPGGGTTSASNGDRLLRAALTAPPATPGGSRPKLLLKIGRAANVQRRLHQWTSQCGYNLALIRYYPHSSASSSPLGPLAGPPRGPPGAVARKTPHSHRVERLIHLELSATPGTNPHRQCATCGKTHKEWFLVDASREGILAVDAVIKRWIAYDEAASAQSRPQPPSAPVPQQKPAPQRMAAAAGGVKMHDKKARPAGATVAAAATAAAATGPATATKPRSVSATTASATAAGTAQATATKPKQRSVSAGTGPGPKKQQQKQRQQGQRGRGVSASKTKRDDGEYKDDGSEDDDSEEG